MTPEARRKLGWFLAVVFVIALLMGPGPGMLLVNEAKSFHGIPALYAWGLLWYGVEVTVVVAAFFFVWTDARDAK